MKKFKFLLFFLPLLFLTSSVSAQNYPPGSSAWRAAQSQAQENADGWTAGSNQVNESFYFVIDKIIDLQEYFIAQAKGIGRIVFFIAVSSAALNYALTGTGLKENLIKIFKAVVFFLVVIGLYPAIIGWITKITFDYALGSVYPSVEKYFNGIVEEVRTETLAFSIGRETNQQSDNSYAGNTFTSSNNGSDGTVYYSATRQMLVEVQKFDPNLFSDITVTRTRGGLTYTTVAPANMFKILLLLAEDTLKFSDTNKPFSISAGISRALKGLVCAAFVIATGVFAILEYLVCFLEFMLVASVGVILFPLSIWEGSKFLSEKFIGAIVGFFMKMLFCNIAIFLLLYGFISIFYTFSEGGFTGGADQIIFIVFTCLLFFYICKSAPAIAQSLLTGTPSLSATGAISAVTGAVGGAMAAGKLAKKIGGAAAGATGAVTGGAAKGLLGFAGSMAEANAAQTSAMEAAAQSGLDKSMIKQAGHKAFGYSLMSDVGDSFKAGAYGLSRKLLGGDPEANPHSWRQDFLNKDQKFTQHLDERRDEGRSRGRRSAEKSGYAYKIQEQPPQS